MIIFLAAFKPVDETLGNFIYNTKIMSVDERITLFLIKQIEAADKAGCINWQKFREYCIETGNKDFGILCVPIPVLDRCIAEARRRANYIDKLNNGN